MTLKSTRFSEQTDSNEIFQKAPALEFTSLYGHCYFIDTITFFRHNVHISKVHFNNILITPLDFIFARPFRKIKQS